MTCDTCIWKSEEIKLEQKQVYSGLTNTVVWVGVRRPMKVCAIANTSVSIESRVIGCDKHDDGSAKIDKNK